MKQKSFLFRYSCLHIDSTLSKKQVYFNMCIGEFSIVNSAQTGNGSGSKEIVRPVPSADATPTIIAVARHNRKHAKLKSAFSGRFCVVVYPSVTCVQDMLVHMLCTRRVNGLPQRNGTTKRGNLDGYTLIKRRGRGFWVSGSSARVGRM